MKFLVPVFSVTLFLSAFLLFGIQPLYSKMLLPYLGGSPMVWNICMVFFQAMLLAGYGYAYFNSKIKNLWIQLSIHAGLFLIFLYFLPFSIQADQIPDKMESPALWQIGFMLGTIGAPFFILSGCAPLLQRWFSHSSHKNADNPYFLYAASNVGSMLSLLCYPFIIEPFFGLDQQSLYWSILYGILIALIMLSGIAIIINMRSKNKVLKEATVTQSTLQPVSMGRRLYWLLMAFIPSSLMLGVTTYITTDIASVPLLWIIPLAMYVGTFIIVFANRQIFSAKALESMYIVGLSFFVCLIFFDVEMIIFAKILLHLAIFFIIALACHKHLVDAKPDASRLTEFYFFMSLGGVMGGIFNALLAPVLFTYTWEYTIVIILSAFLIRPYLLKDEIVKKSFLRGSVYGVIAICFISFAIVYKMAYGYVLPNFFVASLAMVLLLFCYDRRALFASMIAFLFIIHPIHDFNSFKTNSEQIFIARNFFGTIKVVDSNNTRNLLHGTTLHGMQYKTSPENMAPSAYYHVSTSIGEAFTHFTEQNFKQNVAILGLGTGGLACYDAPGRHFDFYEIDQEMLDLSEKYGFYTYLKDCGNEYDVLIGDARLKINEQPDKEYDFIVVDVFSSDNIPVHLMTKEAMQIYMSKLKDDGAILFHISNRYLDLRPVLSAISDNLGLSMVYKKNKFDEEKMVTEHIFEASSVLVSKNSDVLADLKNSGWNEFEEKDNHYLWTDNYANILSAFVLVRMLQGKTTD